jgi:trimethylamine--corrinoid protein Co-methyltransferase
VTVRPRLELLGRDRIESLVGEACHALETIGVAVENETAEALLLEGGGARPAGRVRLPERLVRGALETAPRRFTLHDRDGAPAVELGAGRLQFRLDPATGRRRPATSADVVELVRLVDGLPHFAAQSTALVPADVPAELTDRWRLYLALRHGRKPVVTGTFRKDGFAPMRALLAAVAGGESELAERPRALFDCCPTSPFAWSDLTAQALVDAARAGVPANLIAMPMTGATAPVALEGALVQLAAENLSGLVLHQLAAPGAPIVWGGAPAAFDMRQGSAALAAIESAMLNAANAEVGRHLGLPTHGYLVLSDAKTPDFQAGAESSWGAVLAALAGIDLVSGPGLLDFLLTQSFAKLLLDHELCGAALRLARGIEASPGEWVGLLGELVRAGNLLGHAHTRRHWREELSLPTALVDRASYGDWEAAGATSAAERASAEVARRRATPPPAPLDAERAARLDEIIRAEAVRAGGGPLPSLGAVVD